jgi:hypothetical protein
MAVWMVVLLGAALMVGSSVAQGRYFKMEVAK